MPNATVRLPPITCKALDDKKSVLVVSPTHAEGKPSRRRSAPSCGQAGRLGARTANLSAWCMVDDHEAERRLSDAPTVRATYSCSTRTPRAALPKASGSPSPTRLRCRSSRRPISFPSTGRKPSRWPRATGSGSPALSRRATGTRSKTATPTPWRESRRAETSGSITAGWSRECRTFPAWLCGNLVRLAGPDRAPGHPRHVVGEPRGANQSQIYVSSTRAREMIALHRRQGSGAGGHSGEQSEARRSRSAGAAPSPPAKPHWWERLRH